ncbi:hypothetical protein ACFX2A_005977 [Malus domestica]
MRWREKILSGVLRVGLEISGRLEISRSVLGGSPFMDHVLPCWVIEDADHGVDIAVIVVTDITIIVNPGIANFSVHV